MRSCSCQGKDELFVEDAIDEEPVGGDMAFSESHPIIAQWMVFVVWRQRFASGEFPDDVIKKGDVDFHSPCPVDVSLHKDRACPHSAS